MVLSGVPLLLAGCGTDPVTAPLAAAPAAVSLAGHTVQAVGRALTPPPPPPPATQKLAEGRALLIKLNRGEKKLADLNEQERQTLRTLMLAAQRARERD
jgi:hypothetical protein